MFFHLQKMGRAHNWGWWWPCKASDMNTISNLPEDRLILENLALILKQREGIESYWENNTARR